MAVCKEFSIDGVYELYRTQISEMIAYIEVYEHDLPPLITGLISEVFTTIAVAESAGEEEVLGLHYLIQTVVQAIRLHAIFVFIHEIGEREKLFKRYKYKGAMIPGEDIHIFDKIQEMKKIAVSNLTDKLKRYYRRSICSMFSIVRDSDSQYGIRDLLIYFKDFAKLYVFKRLIKWEEPFIPLDFLVIEENESLDLSKEYSDFRQLLSFCENHMSDVINTGPKTSLRSNVFVAVTSWIIPIIIGVPAVKYVINGVMYILEMMGR